jgi:hypothetical protein
MHCFSQKVDTDSQERIQSFHRTAAEYLRIPDVRYSCGKSDPELNKSKVWMGADFVSMTTK